MSDDYDFLFKTIVVGDGGCGKTALVIRFSQGYFQEQYKLTIGVEFAVSTVELKDGKRVKLQIWDTGGQERFQYVRPMYYRGAMGGILLFDLSNRESFEHIPRWIEEVNDNTGEIPLLLVGNKSDLVHERQVSYLEAEELANKFQMYYLESSAKDGTGVGDVFAILSCIMIGIDVPQDYLQISKTTEIEGRVTEEKTPFEPVKPLEQPLEQPSLPPAFLNIPEVPKKAKTEPFLTEQNKKQEYESEQIPKSKLEPKLEPEPEEWAIPDMPVPIKPFSNKVELPSKSQISLPTEKEIEESIPEIPKSSVIPSTGIQGPITFDDFENTSDKKSERSGQPEGSEQIEQLEQLKPIKSSAPPPLIFKKAEEIRQKEPEPESKVTLKPSEPAVSKTWELLTQKSEPKIIIPKPITPKKRSFQFGNAQPAPPPLKFKSKKSSDKLLSFLGDDNIFPFQPKKQDSSKGILFGSDTPKKESGLNSVNSLLGALGSKQKSKSKQTSFNGFTAFSDGSSQKKSDSSLFIPEIDTKQPIKPSFITQLEEEKGDIKEKKKKKKKRKEKKDTDIVICSNCGALLNSKYSFCNKCGSKITR
ncbi:MAG: GTP-binding protein [Promethearchaeota archaeon]